jgi:hypothetical protein
MLVLFIKGKIVKFRFDENCLYCLLFVYSTVGTIRVMNVDVQYIKTYSGSSTGGSPALP